MPHRDKEKLRLYKKEYYEANRDSILKDTKDRYVTRDDLFRENSKLKKQIKELSDKLLASVEGKKYSRQPEDIKFAVSNGNYSVNFD